MSEQVIGSSPKGTVKKRDVLQPQLCFFVSMCVEGIELYPKRDGRAIFCVVVLHCLASSQKLKIGLATRSLHSGMTRVTLLGHKGYFEQSCTVYKPKEGSFVVCRLPQKSG